MEIVPDATVKPLLKADNELITSRVVLFLPIVVVSLEREVSLPETVIPDENICPLVHVLLSDKDINPEIDEAVIEFVGKKIDPDVTDKPLLKRAGALNIGDEFIVNEFADDVPKVASPETVNEPEFVPPFVEIPELNVCNCDHVLALVN
jgi:hypothetical protein